MPRFSAFGRTRPEGTAHAPAALPPPRPGTGPAADEVHGGGLPWVGLSTTIVETIRRLCVRHRINEIESVLPGNALGCPGGPWRRMGPRYTQESEMNAVAIREQTQAVPDGRTEALHPDANPYMTRAARAARIAWRLEHLEEWHCGLETLFYYDPEYAYDVVHEYEDDWTTDPDHSGNGIEFCEYDEDGVLEPIDDRRTMLEGDMLFLLRRVLGNRAESQGRLYYPGDLAEDLELLTRGGNRGSYVKPDLMVFPPAYVLPADAHRDRSDCALRVHEGAPPPELVVEILLVSSVARDYGVKRQLYAALGVREYWICDVGGIRHPDSPVSLQVYRLTGGTYAEFAPAWMDAAQDDAPAFWSEVCNRHIHVVRGDYAPRFQWYDEDQGRWRDNETDAQDEKDRLQQVSEARGEARGMVIGREQGLVEGRAAVAVAALHSLLSDCLHANHRERIAEYWRREGPPEDVMDRILTVQQTPDEWRALLLLDASDNDGSPRRNP